MAAVVCRLADGLVRSDSLPSPDKEFHSIGNLKVYISIDTVGSNITD